MLICCGTFVLCAKAFHKRPFSISTDRVICEISSTGTDSESQATCAILQGLPHSKSEVLATGTEATTRLHDVTLQRVRDAPQERS